MAAWVAVALAVALRVALGAGGFLIVLTGVVALSASALVVVGGSSGPGRRGDSANRSRG